MNRTRTVRLHGLSSRRDGFTYRTTTRQPKARWDVREIPGGVWALGFVSLSQDAGGKAIEPGSLSIEDPCQHGRDRTGEAAAEDIGQIVGADKNA